MKATMKDMNSSEKLKYFFYYYKWHMFILLLAVFFVLSIINFIYQRSLPVSISYAVINNSNLNEETDYSIFSEYTAEYGLQKGYKMESVTDIILSEATFGSLEASDETSNYKYMSFATYCGQNYFDIALTDKTGLELCSSKGHLHPVDSIISSDNLGKCTGRLTECASPEGTNAVYGIDISDIPIIKNMHLRYKDVYICFPGNSEQNITNANRFLEFILK
jgi:hypothetical protein